MRRSGPALIAFALLLGVVPSAHAQRTLRGYRRIIQHWPRFQVQANGRSWGTYTFEGHVHTDHSHDAHHPTADVLELAERADLDALVITDHGCSAARLDIEDYHGPVTAMVGEEVGGSFGHAVIWNVPARTGVQDARITLRELGAYVHAQGGLLVLAHPGWWMSHNTFDPRRWMDAQALRHGGISEHVDALELWNAVYHRRSRELIDQWLALIEQGIFVPIVGGSDFHTYLAHYVGTPRNVFLCPVDQGGALAQPLRECLMDSVRTGRLFVSDGPIVSLLVEGRTFGDVLEVRPGAHVSVSARAIAPEGGRLQIFMGRQVAAELELPAGEERTGTWTLRAPAGDSFVRAEIARATPNPDAPPFSMITNPIRLEVAPVRVSWRGPDEEHVEPPEGYRRPGDRALLARRDRLER